MPAKNIPNKRKIMPKNTRLLPCEIPIIIKKMEINISKTPTVINIFDKKYAIKTAPTKTARIIIPIPELSFFPISHQLPFERFLHQDIEQVVNVLSGLALMLSELYDLLNDGCEFLLEFDGWYWNFQCR